MGFLCGLDCLWELSHLPHLRTITQTFSFGGGCHKWDQLVQGSNPGLAGLGTWDSDLGEATDMFKHQSKHNRTIGDAPSYQAGLAG